VSEVVEKIEIIFSLLWKAPTTKYPTYPRNTPQLKMSERIFEALAIVALHGFSKDIKSCAYLDKSTYQDPYFLNTLGDNAYGLLKGAAAIQDVKRMKWILEHARMPKLPIGWLIKWCIDKRLQNSAICLLEHFHLPHESAIWTAPGLMCFYPLEAACRTSQTQLAMWLLEHGVNPNCHTHSNPPLISAVRTHNIGLFKLLLARGADIHAEDFTGFSAPWHAVKCGANDIYEFCHARGYYGKGVTIVRT
jgi:hypothetical protein